MNEQARRDAIADAETLRRNILKDYGNSGPRRNQIWRLLEAAGQRGLGIVRNGYVPGVAKELAAEAAHCVFRVVPGLRQ